MYRELLKRYLKTMRPSLISSVIGSIIGVFVSFLFTEEPFSISNIIMRLLLVLSIQLLVYVVAFIIICILKKIKKI